MQSTKYQLREDFERLVDCIQNDDFSGALKKYFLHLTTVHIQNYYL